MEINSDAIFIADAHIKSSKEGLINTLKIIYNKAPSQIFLLGDISHCLVGNIPTSKKINIKLLVILRKLSNESNIFYFEGNHDFALEYLRKIIPKLIVITRNMQPFMLTIKCNSQNKKMKKILLAHGDIFLNRSYELYIRIITSKPILYILFILDIITFGKLYCYIHKKVLNKSIKIPNKELSNKIVKQRIQKYEQYIKDKNIKDIYAVLEGHFHINCSINEYKSNFLYIPLPPFYKSHTIFNINKIKHYLL